MEKNNEKEITITIEGKEWKDAIDKAFEEANKKVKIDGFRPGKAPKDVFYKKYGKESLFLGLALSLDAFCVGIGSGIIGINSFIFPFLTS